MNLVGVELNNKEARWVGHKDISFFRSNLDIPYFDVIEEDVIEEVVDDAMVEDVVDVAEDEVDVTEDVIDEAIQKKCNLAEKFDMNIIKWKLNARC